MKAEITQENRERFIAQYHGQEVLFHQNLNQFQTKPTLNRGRTTLTDKSCVLLTPLSAITDEDAIEVAKINGSITDDNLLVGKSICHWLHKMGTNRDITFESVDFLRSRGYALPFLGLSVEELISAGWIKLVES